MTVSKKYNNQELGVSIRPRRFSQLTSLENEEHLSGACCHCLRTLSVLRRQGYMAAASLVRPLGLHTALRCASLAISVGTALPISSMSLPDASVTGGRRPDGAEPALT